MKHTFFIKYLSYLFPISTWKKSEYSGDLEISWFRGKKRLNTKHANYSYGSLQEVLAYGLKKITFDPDEEILLLGMGAGSVIETLRKKMQYKKYITAIELDAKIVDIAKREFAIENSHRLKIKTKDAYEFVQNHKHYYGLIIVDLFIDDLVPDKFYEHQFWERMHKLLKPNGVILFNAGMTEDTDQKIKELQLFIDDLFSVEIFPHPTYKNRLMVAKKMIDQS